MCTSKQIVSIICLMLNRELGIGIVAYSPLGRGFFSLGPKVVESFPEGDYRKVCTFLNIWCALLRCI